MIVCPSVTTGDQFLVATLGHLDCQAQTLGSFGFQALSAPGSPAALALTGVLTLFIALYAIRILLSDGVHGHDAVNGILKIGIVLTLAVSWPAFRILAYDTVLLGPAEIASAMTPATLPDTDAGFTQRLQNLDTGIASLTLVGSGRQTGSLELEQRKDASFRTIAMADETAFGWARTVYLSAVIASLAILRIAAGLLLALAPLIAAFLLFDFARGLFAGWLRGLVLVALGSLGITLLLAVQVAVMEPWLADALQRRSLGYATPSAPTELLALTVAFAVASGGLLAILGKVAFQNAWAFKFERRSDDRPGPATVSLLSARRAGSPIELTAHARALTVSEGVLNLVRHEEARRSPPQLALAGPTQNFAAQPSGGDPSVRVGSSWRRTSRRATAAHAERDKRS
jgi:type IV secretion system protein VirB6